MSELAYEDLIYTDADNYNDNGYDETETETEESDNRKVSGTILHNLISRLDYDREDFMTRERLWATIFIINENSTTTTTTTTTTTMNAAQTTSQVNNKEEEEEEEDNVTGSGSGDGESKVDLNQKSPAAPSSEIIFEKVITLIRPSSI